MNSRLILRLSFAIMRAVISKVEAVMRIYLAGPLFSEAERDWLKKLQLEMQNSGYEVVWPYELFEQSEVDSWGDEAAGKIMEYCRDALADCDLVVALLDGAQVDDGTAWEIGFARARGMPVFGIRTDFRFGGETANGRVNAMIAGSCETIAGNKKELLSCLKEKAPAKAVADQPQKCRPYKSSPMRS